jgi:V/A-type H+/Na+-transporting ATPase subunit D
MVLVRPRVLGRVVVSQIPPGRAGRPWLNERIATATHGEELLRQKQQLLSREWHRLVDHREETVRAWTEAQAVADRWSTRADALSGTTATRLAGQTTAATAEVVFTWRNTMGALHPDTVSVSASPPPLIELAVANSALGPSAEAHRRALEAAARHAAATSALRALEVELATTRRRLRAIQRHRLPWLEGELRALELRLDEVEREERLSTRWAAQRLTEEGPP